MDKTWLLACGHWVEYREEAVRKELPGVSFEVHCDECTVSDAVVGYGFLLKGEMDE